MTTTVKTRCTCCVNLRDVRGCAAPKLRSVGTWSPFISYFNRCEAAIAPCEVLAYIYGMEPTIQWASLVHPFLDPAYIGLVRIHFAGMDIHERGVVVLCSVGGMEHMPAPIYLVAADTRPMLALRGALPVFGDPWGPVECVYFP